MLSRQIKADPRKTTMPHALRPTPTPYSAAVSRSGGNIDSAAVNTRYPQTGPAVPAWTKRPERVAPMAGKPA